MKKKFYLNIFLLSIQKAFSNPVFRKKRVSDLKDATSPVEIFFHATRYVSFKMLSGLKYIFSEDFNTLPADLLTPY